ncbi:growth-regulating factor 5-like isoform X1 [Chenopodium quinoa]|uniref:Growth-regulating factor n=1 Tax=Chenopodium quinoa TaxID=63459 RepID=A0A803KST6_CHEQI|nr:growth-regulating factor 5-like isoform X1 [Chenopodium quinoa]
MNRGGSEGVSPFTVSQWQELEHQALIYKYLIAGLSVPPDLVLPIQNSFGTSSSAFFHRPTLGYCGRENSLYGIGIGIGYGKKIDPEPGRCRRTDGKKWRCAKEAYPDSKYCERHMNRGRSRSRKHVESNPFSSSSSTTTSVSVLNQSLPLKFNAFASASNAAAPTSNPNQSQFQLDSIPYAIPTKQYSRHLQGSKPEAGDNRSFSQCSGGNRSLIMDSALDNTWPSLSPQMSSLSQSKPMDNSSLHDDYSHRSFINCEFGQPQSVKQGNRSLHPFFEEWPNTREAWSGLEDERANQVSFSTTQLSISVPMTTTDFSASPRSPQGEVTLFIK